MLDVEAQVPLEPRAQTAERIVGGEHQGADPLHQRRESILLHGDTPGAVALAKMVRNAIERDGGRVVPLSRVHT